jgi:uncharacterized Fe-S cluster protein YjdI
MTMPTRSVTKEYSNDQVTIIWQNSLCIHCGNCVKNLPSVFKPKQSPWINIDNDTTNEIINAVKKCPSGALSYRLTNAAM